MTEREKLSAGIVTEREFVNRAKMGEKEAQSVLYQMYYFRLERFFLRSTGNFQKAQDLAQDTAIKACFEKIESFSWQSDKPFGAWVYTIAYNHLASDRKKWIRRPTPLRMLDNSIMNEIDVEKTVEVRILYEMALDHLWSLPSGQSEVIHARFVEGLSIRETARKLGRSEVAVKVSQNRGLEKLRKKFSSNGFSDILNQSAKEESKKG